MATLVTYTLLILDVLVLALLIQLVVFGPIWLVRHRRRRSHSDRPIAAPGPASAESSAGFGFGARKRRCDDCRSDWLGEPGTDASLSALRLRRAVRRRAKRRGRPVPDWAAKRGWDRCPSCFSTSVRDSGQIGVGG